jgi:hypothetical protein
MDSQDIIRYQLSYQLGNQHKITFMTNYRAFVWVVMPFGVKNGSPTYQKAITKMFHEFMKIFFDDFTIFNDMLTYIEIFKKCFFKM